jgi:hypothetical protein
MGFLLDAIITQDRAALRRLITLSDSVEPDRA